MKQGFEPPSCALRLFGSSAHWIGVFIVLVHYSLSAADTNIVTWGTGGVTTVPDLPTNAIAVTGGDSHGIALLADRTVQTWGVFAYGGSLVPPPDATNIVSIAAGSNHALAVRDDGRVILWGRLLGNSATNVAPEATNVVVVGVGTGAQHALALRADGTVVDWGSYETTNIPPTAVNIVSVAAGARHSLALRADGQVVAWGNNSYGQTNVPPNATNIVEIATTWHANIVISADGKLLTWGVDFSPAIGPQPPTATFVEAAGGGGFGGGGMVLRQDGTVISSGAPVSATNIMTIGASGTAYMAAKAMGAPIFPLPAVARTVVAGRRAYFKLRTVGARPIRYQWSLYGTNLPAATNSVLVVTNVQRANTGPYVLTASNALGVTISSPMMLNIEASALTIQKTATNTLMISWPSPSTGFDLKMNTDLASTNWSTPPESVVDNGTIKFIIVDPSIASRFYRLVYP